ncbi:hypothetical protein [Candidatus Methanoperedens nitratireducens]|nr:hypothetical protein [Candidatus Methanoperedens nitroreducens]
MIGIGESQSFPEITKEPYSPANPLSDAIVRTYWAKKSAERMTGVGKMTDLGLAWVELNEGAKKVEIKNTLVSQEIINNLLEDKFEEQRNRVKQMTTEIQNNLNEVFLGTRIITKK